MYGVLFKTQTNFDNPQKPYDFLADVSHSFAYSNGGGVSVMFVSETLVTNGIKPFSLPAAVG